jgi:hypothetical protein
MKHLLLSLIGLGLSFSAFSEEYIRSTQLNQYECIDSNNQPLLSYFHPRMPPNPIPVGSPELPVCHDISVYGPFDDVLFPRLNQQTAKFLVWDNTSPYFYDNNGDGVTDINSVINLQAIKLGAKIPRDLNWFFALILPSLQTMGNNFSSLGYFMAAFINPETFKSSCLNSTTIMANPIYKSLKAALGAETEGLYLGERLTGLKDLILVRESELKKNWFYYRNGVATTQTEETVASTPTFFVQDDVVFQLKGLNEVMWDLNSLNYLPNGQSTYYPTHDHKIGCVPKQ